MSDFTILFVVYIGWIVAVTLAFNLTAKLSKKRAVVEPLETIVSS